MSVPNDQQTDVTLGEVWRGQERLRLEMESMGKDISSMKTTLATQGVKVGVIWGIGGVAVSALITALVAIVLGH